MHDEIAPVSASMPEATAVVRAAEYVRMSTEHQRYSIENQSEAIRTYASARGMALVRSYVDHGKSGLQLHGRAGLQRLLADVEARTMDYSVVLVYDVSRWGRFQDSDEGAFYEHACQRAGVRVVYCAEMFPDDGTPFSALLKEARRVMAAEYSRDLSARVTRGRRRLIDLGFRQGGAAGFGLRRMAIGADGRSKGILNRGEQKTLQTDRVILVPGPREEVEWVWRIYEMYVFDKLSETAIIRRLKVECAQCPGAPKWTRPVLCGILTNAKYMGSNVANRTICRLTGPRISVPKDQWLVREKTFCGLVSPRLFWHAQAERKRRSGAYSTVHLKTVLADLLARKGKLTGAVINAEPGMPRSAVYIARFGSLKRAYAAIGYRRPHIADFAQIAESKHTIRRELMIQLATRFESAGIKAEWRDQADTLILAGSWRIALLVLRSYVTRKSHSPMWTWYRPKGQISDWEVLVRLEAGNQAIKDMFLIHQTDVEALPKFLNQSATRFMPYRVIGLDQIVERTLAPAIDVDPEAVQFRMQW